MNKPAVVIDNGTGFSKLGYAGQITPSYLIPTCIAGETTFTGPNKEMKDLDFYIGHEAQERSTSMQVTWPIRHGIIEDWNTMERFWEHAFFKYLRCDPEEHNVLLTEPPLNPPENREQTAEIMFETFGVKGLYIAVQAVLALCASWGSKNSQNNMTGTVVDIGDGVTHVIPVVDGGVIASAIKHVPIAGRDITTFIQGIQRTREKGVPTRQAMEVARTCKERYSYLCKDLLVEFQKYSMNPEQMIIQHQGVNTVTKQPFTIDVGYERFLGPEIFFNPSILSPQYTRSLPQLVDDTIQGSPIDCRKGLYKNIVLSGGSTIFDKFGTRLQRDVRNIVQDRLDENARAHGLAQAAQIDINVVTHNKQRYAVFAGGALLASLPQFEQFVHTKEQYEEYGPSICRHNVIFGN